ncbi:Dam family site-specific DNA-(adenine-N6)-methyltransferase [Algibacter sp. 2305UL17-15]|uniref:DNA adenine methylase n=1 Tax=Algibacter sp. 2305UL17-15 TaxID=3231268 RepID=UPI003458E38D
MSELKIEDRNQIIKDAKPFLRWAGGKKWLLKDIEKFLPKTGFNNYHEPFLGGGAVFFYLKPYGVSYLNDLNEELIDTYSCIKEDVEAVIEDLKVFKNNKDFYYDIRSKKLRKDSKKAARFIFLNQTSFNGIYRVNLKGEYNVPFGFRKKDFFEPENLRVVSNALNNTVFTKGDFNNTLKNIEKGDLVFLDPPYTITHNNNGFFKYNQKLFSLENQYELSEMIDKIKSIDAYYILTNAAHKKVKEIFNKEDKILKLKRASLIGGTNAKRGKYSEYIFTNCIK